MNLYRVYIHDKLPINKVVVSSTVKNAYFIDDYLRTAVKQLKNTHRIAQTKKANR